jgi:hypothetical protein
VLLSEHLAILSMDNVQPSAAVTLPIALTSVVHSWQEVLYPFLHMPTEPELSTQIRTGRLRQLFLAAETQTSGPTSSRADNFLLKRFPSVPLMPQFMR